MWPITPFASPHPPLFAIFAICFILILCNFRTATTPQRAIQNQIGAAGAEWQFPQHPPRLLRLPQRQRLVPKKTSSASSALSPVSCLSSPLLTPPFPSPGAIRSPAESRLSPEQPALTPQFSIRGQLTPVLSVSQFEEREFARGTSNATPL